MSERFGTPSINRPASVARSAAVKRLKTFYKITLADDDFDLAAAIIAETDRGSVILLTTAVEDQLTRRIKAEMVDLTSDESNRLFGPDAPLGSFSAKIKLGYALGAIDGDISSICDLLREMRNACAHSGRPVSFADPELSDVMQAAFSYTSDEYTSPDAYKAIDMLGKMHLIWLTAWLMHAIRTGDKSAASELVNELIADATDHAGAALKRQRTSQKKRLEQSPPKGRSRQKE